MNSDSYVDFFRQTSPYIHKHRGKTFVIALDGNTVAHANFHRTIHDIALLQSLGIRIVLVHGARPQIDQRITQAGEQSQFHNQLRITDSSAMQSVKEALGITRWQIEAELSTGLPNSPMHGAQIKAIGGNFITAKPMGILNGVDYQHTGEVRGIDADSIQQQLQMGGLVLLSPIGFSPTGEAFNLSYQEVAAQTAIAINAEKLILVTEVSGILEDNNLLRSLSVPEAKALANEKR
jgi:amino-acid N-acetyltransferase